eukprot:CAMPEP_0179047204 /NCGR_PEP_ID=MMETSP0796-20121207/19078_1 /TAXON_ID=73915 /ORGANISM="Pyrodinium bahamense, Strain pbaha01" /LENGTH=808 /DNA_ID=CAMNT_0020743645 /DNA_START=1 /DNA_END=2424 /DNA_ORIENTATION=-
MRSKPGLFPGATLLECALMMTSSGGGQDSATYYNGPLQLIRIDDNGKCHLQENAVSILSQIQGRLAVVGIAGLYRTGKSFLLNRLLGLQEGFEIGPSVNPCTKGLWIWGQPVQLASDYHCILIDTEGLGSTQRTASCDMQIFSLCILLCSYFIYNSMGAIDEQAIDDLHLVLHLAKHIHVKTKKGSDAEKASELSQYFPIFLWVLRDFHLRLVDDKGATISERDYLENALKPIPGQEEKNKLRDVIKDLFRDRDCVTIVRPVADESDLRNIQRLPYESLRPQFRTQVESFVKKAYMNMKPKKIEGATVSGSMFVNLASEYCKAINSSAVPTIQSAWTSVVQHQLRLCLKDAVQVYRSQMNDKAMQHLPMNEDKLHDTHKAAKAEALKVFLAIKFDSNDSKFREYRSELASRIKQLYEHVKSENASTSQRQCERFAKELYSRHIDNKLSVRGSYQNFEQLMQDWEHVRKTYVQKTAGPAQVETLSTWLFQRMTESVQRVWDDLRVATDERHSALQRKLSEAEAKSVNVRDVLDNERSKQSDSLEVAKKQWLVERIDLERQLEDARRGAEEAALRSSREKAQLIDSERTLREQMKILQERLQSSVADSRRSAQMDSSSSAAAELHSLRDAVVAMMSEVRGTDMEKRQLEMKSEHEKQLIGLERKFQRQLMDARRKNESLIESLRQTYEDEVDGLKTYRSELLQRNKDLEKELERAKGEVEVLRGRVSAAENERALQRRFVENAQRQSELVAAFLERCPGRGGRELQAVHEELGALSSGGSGDSPLRGSGLPDSGGREAPRRGSSGSMPYS